MGGLPFGIGPVKHAGGFGSCRPAPPFAASPRELFARSGYIRAAAGVKWGSPARRHPKPRSLHDKLHSVPTPAVEGAGCIADRRHRCAGRAMPLMYFCTARAGMALGRMAGREREPTACEPARKAETGAARERAVEGARSALSGISEGFPPGRSGRVRPEASEPRRHARQSAVHNALSGVSTPCAIFLKGRRGQGG